MTPRLRQTRRNGKRRIQRRLDKGKLPRCDRPQFAARNIHYELAGRCRGIGYGGIGAIQQLVRPRSRLSRETAIAAYRTTNTGQPTAEKAFH